MARVLALHRSGVRRVRCVHRPWKLRDEHSGRCGLRLPSALGRRARQSHGDALSGTLGEARHRNWEKPCGTLPRACSQAARLCNVDRQRVRGDGDRPRRVPRRDRRALLALSHSDAGRRRNHGGRYVRHTRAPPLRFPSDGSAHRFVRRRRRRLLHRRNAAGEAELVARVLSLGRPVARGLVEHC